MADIYDFSTGEKVEDVAITKNDFLKRFLKCLENVEKYGQCSCSTCESKKLLADRLYHIILYLAQDYCEQTGETFYTPDIFEIALTATELIKREITK